MMDNKNTHLDEIPADSVPAPVCQFDFKNGTAVVRGVNQPFDERLLAVQSGEPLATVFEACELSTAWETVETALRRGGQFTLSTHDDTQYRVDVTPPEDSAAGTLLSAKLQRPHTMDSRSTTSQASSATTSGIHLTSPGPDCRPPGSSRRTSISTTSNKHMTAWSELSRTS